MWGSQSWLQPAFSRPLELVLRRRKQTQVDRLRHGLVSRIPRMQMIPGVILGLKHLGIRQVTRYGIEIQHGVEGSATDKLIHGLAHRLARVAIVCRTGVRRERSAD